MPLTTPHDLTHARRAGDEACAERVNVFADLLVAGDAPAAETIVRELMADGVSATVVLARLVHPAMTRIGEQWECSTLTVADEHLAVTIAHHVLAVLYEHLLEAPFDSRGRVLLAAAEGDRHALGLRMVADVLEGAGYRVIYLGADVPNDALLAAVARHRPSIVGLSASLTLVLPAVHRAIAAIAASDPEIHVIVGGAAAAHLGSDGPTLHVIDDVSDVRAIVDAIAPAGDRSTHDEERVGDVEQTYANEVDRHSAFYENAMLRAGDLARLHARRAQEFRVVALRDSLTGLWNRRAFDDRVLDLVGDASGTPLTMLMLDIDRFKQVNDVHGHQVGDHALQQVAECILKALRPTDFAARLGGDEFVVLLPSTSLADATKVAERIRASVERDADPAFTVSIGVKQCDDDVRASILAADTSLYEAKGSGRNAVCAVA